MTKIKIREWVHANICVRDLARSIPFYEMLGFEKFDDNVFEQGAGVWDGLGLPEGRRFRAVFMKIPGDRPRPFLDIIQFLDPPTAGEPYPTLHNVGIGRLASRSMTFSKSRRFSKRTRSRSSDLFRGTKPQGYAIARDRLQVFMLQGSGRCHPRVHSFQPAEVRATNITPLWLYPICRWIPSE